MLRFLHMADLHLCSPLSALPARVAAGVRSRQMTALKDMLTTAVDRGAHILPAYKPLANFSASGHFPTYSSSVHQALASFSSSPR